MGQNTNSTICTIDFTPIFGEYVYVSKEELFEKKIEIIEEIRYFHPGISVSEISDGMVRDHIQHTKLSQYHAIYIILVAFLIPAVLAILSYGILVSKMAKFDKQ